MKRNSVERWLFATLILGGFVCSLATLPARADDWSKTYTLTGKPDLRVETSDANIRVSTWDQSTIEAKVTTTRYKIDDDGIRIDEHQSGDTVEINVRYPHHGVVINWGNYGSHRVEIDIHIPREGRVDLHTGDGKIELANFKGEMQLRSGDGSQEIESVDAHAAGGSAIASSWRLESGDGTVTLEVPENLAADVDMHTGDGHIDLDMPITTTGKIRENEVRGKINGGGNLLVIHTGDGSIRLRKG